MRGGRGWGISFLFVASSWVAVATAATETKFRCDELVATLAAGGIDESTFVRLARAEEILGRKPTREERAAIDDAHGRETIAEKARVLATAFPDPRIRRLIVERFVAGSPELNQLERHLVKRVQALGNRIPPSWRGPNGQGLAVVTDPRTFRPPEDPPPTAKLDPETPEDVKAWFASAVRTERGSDTWFTLEGNTLHEFVEDGSDVFYVGARTVTAAEKSELEPFLQRRSAIPDPNDPGLWRLPQELGSVAEFREVVGPDGVRTVRFVGTVSLPQKEFGELRSTFDDVNTARAHREEHERIRRRQAVPLIPLVNGTRTANAAAAEGQFGYRAGNPFDADVAQRSSFVLPRKEPSAIDVHVSDAKRLGSVLDRVKKFPVNSKNDKVFTPTALADTVEFIASLRTQRLKVLTKIETEKVGQGTRVVRDVPMRAAGSGRESGELLNTFVPHQVFGQTLNLQKIQRRGGNHLFAEFHVVFVDPNTGVESRPWTLRKLSGNDYWEVKLRGDDRESYLSSDASNHRLVVRLSETAKEVTVITMGDHDAVSDVPSGL